ncbi:LOW QUALITY PROTEIN: zf-RVT domain-containing protein, partial [Cephalotus follicularis]
GELPVKYLGVLLVSTKLGQKDCQALFELIMRRVKAWVANYLSFGGRLQLILATLVSIQVFRCRTFTLPVSVVKMCESILRNFLWFGVGDAKRAGKVAWAKFCHPKDEGGLGIKSLRTWNKAAIMQLVKITAASSWSWRNVLKLREGLARNLVYYIGDGSATCLWWDPWINSKDLITMYGAWVPFDADIPVHAKVSTVIVNKQWAWPLNSWELREIDTLIRQKSIEQGLDIIHWLSKGKTFSYKATWQVVHIHPKVAWADIVWFSDCIPKHSFCLWLTFHNAYRTTDKLRTYGVVAANHYMFGCGGLESIDHLFFACKFTAEI